MSALFIVVIILTLSFMTGLGLGWLSDAIQRWKIKHRKHESHHR